MMWKLKYALSLALLLLISLPLAACQLTGGATDPPRPTIVPDHTPTDPPDPTATPVAAQPTLTATPPPSPTTTLLPSPTTAPTDQPPTATPAPSPTPPPPTATPTATVVATAPLEALSLSLELIANGFTKPLYLTHAGDGSGRLFVVEQAGRIFTIADGHVNPTPFLDIVPIVGSDGNEQGLLSVAFHPNYQTNGQFFVYYTDKNGDVVIARYHVSDNPDLANADSPEPLLTIGQPFANHNGGQLVFGADGYLYAGLGDGGSGGDPQNNGQSLGTLLGKILRLDVDQGNPYGVPESNPFVNQANARPEIWSYGWRNPWRFSFDRATQDMYIADVGQNQFEEVNVEPAGSPAGQNYGWRLMEGFHCFASAECEADALGLVLPVTEYDHGQGCSVTGGYVYRGPDFPQLTGTYLYGDFCSGTIWGLRQQADGAWAGTELLRTNHLISSFGQDERGELYLIDHSGGSVLHIRAE